MVSKNFDPQFALSVLRINDGIGTLPEDLRKELEANASAYVRRYSCWLFEGDWETTLDPWMEKQNIECLGEIITSQLGGLSQRRLEKLLQDNFDWSK